MAIRATDVEMVLTVDEKIVVTARFTKHAAAHDSGAWIVFALRSPPIHLRPGRRRS